MRIKTNIMQNVQKSIIICKTFDDILQKSLQSYAKSLFL